MLLTVYDLTAEQLKQVKEAFFDQDETQDILPEEITSPEQIPDEIILEHYGEMIFNSEDFMEESDNEGK